MVSSPFKYAAAALLLALPAALSQGHNHTGHDDHPCHCEAEEQKWEIDCTKKAVIQASMEYLELAANKCGKTTPDHLEDCEKNFLIIQAHHDHCEHDDLPKGVEEELHEYEDLYTHCTIHRKYVEGLPACTKFTGATGDVTAAGKVLNESCTANCSSTACGDAYRTIFTAHEAFMPGSGEILHDYEDVCEDQACNLAVKGTTFNHSECEEEGAHSDHNDDHSGHAHAENNTAATTDDHDHDHHTTTDDHDHDHTTAAGTTVAPTGTMNVLTSLKATLKGLKDGLVTTKAALTAAKAAYAKACPTAKAAEAACKTSKTALDTQEKGVMTQESAIKAAEDAVTNAESSASAKVVASTAFVVAAAIATAVF